MDFRKNAKTKAENCETTKSSQNTDQSSNVSSSEFQELQTKYDSV